MALFFALIVLVILLIGGIIVAHSINASLFGAGNLAFRRDLVTQSDAVVAQAMSAVATAGSGASGAIPDLKNDYPQANYSATVLPVNGQGIPNALLTDGFGSAQPIRTGLNNSVTINYIIERLCNQTGQATADNCVRAPGNASGGGTALPTPPPAGQGSVVYRLSARVTGPRGTQAFFQTTFSGPAG